MRTIWKYELKILDDQIVEVPFCSEFLSLHTQNGKPCIWVYVDSEETKKEKWHISMFGTGHEVSGHFAKFLGTILTHGDALVWHAFLKYVEG